MNRGWVSKKNVSPETRKSGQVEGTVDIVGIVRKEENRPQFAPKSQGDSFLYR